MLGLFQSIANSQDSAQGITPSFCHWTKTDWSAFIATAMGGNRRQDNASPSASPPTSFSLLHLPYPSILPSSSLCCAHRSPAAALREDHFSSSCFLCSCLTALAFTLAWMVLRRGSIKQSIPAQGGEERQDMYMLGWP